MKRLPWPVLATCTIIATASTGAHEGATGLVAERMTAMKETAARMKALDQALKDGFSVTPDMVANAEMIATQAHSLSGLFPTGSGGGHSEARAEVWTQRKAFEKAMQAFAADSDELVSAARSKDFAETRRRFREVADRCLGCHEKFRTRNH
jgi:cytochrome c556